MAARKHLVSLSFGALITMIGCAPSVHQQEAGAPSSQPLAQDLKAMIACDDSRDQLFEAYYRAYAAGAALSDQSPSVHFEKAPEGLRSELDAIHGILAGRVKSLALEKTLAQAVEVREGEAPEAESDPLLHMIRLEMGSKIDPVYEDMNRTLEQRVASLRSLAREQGFACAPRNSLESQSAQALDSRIGDAVYGARRTMATAYQSCQVLDLPPVDNSVPNVLGVVKGQKHGAGYDRIYTDVKLLKRTHYYHRVTRFNGACVSQDKKPLVYDYGGVPKIVDDHTLDLFANVGGGPALGIDCSAFVSTAVSMAGLRYQKSKANRASYTRFLSSDFISAERSNWNCFEQVTVNDQSTIRPGDIAAYNGHVVMVDSVGADPLGLKGVWDRSQCDQLSARNFDFVLIQSSSSKEHLGINRYWASEYLADGGHMADLFLAHARAACLSKFDHQDRVPSTKSAGMIRHRGTSACLAPRVTLTHEACTASCANM